MGFLKNLTKLATNIIVTPITIVKDTVNIVTLQTDKKLKTGDKISEIGDNIEDLIDND